MKKGLGIMMVLFLALSCGKTVLNAELNKEFSIKHDDKVVIDNEDLEVEFTNVTEDSRCPEGTNCIWEGRVVVQLMVNNHLVSVSTQTAKDTLGYNFEIKEVLPLKTTSVIGMDSYILKLIISK